MLKNILTCSFKIFTLFGIPVYLHSTFLIMLLIVTLFSPPTGLIFTVAFTFVLMHEFGHALAAKWLNMGVESITMLPIGGVALIGDLRCDPKKELIVTFAGPLVNASLASVLSIPVMMSSSFPHWMASAFILGWWINILLFAFNMIPCFPMDGGRILRAILCLCWGDLVKATRVAVLVGRVFGCMFVAFGIYFIHIMWIVIGIVIMLLAEAEYRMIKQAVDMETLQQQLREWEELR
tara:strand:- start:3745 stop:4452 length:708 start_codon:yes stop_codon:yes gene_type:complete